MRRIATLTLFFVCLGCRTSGGAKPSPAVDDLGPAVMRRYAEIALSSYSDALGAAQKLEAAIAAFVEKPSAAGLEGAREAWRRARVPYSQTEVFRFYDGPIDALEMYINTWPIDENYIDALEAPKTGIVNDSATYPLLDKSLLTRINEKDSERNISIGFHAIEFLLWGRDTSAAGPGDRPLGDFVDQPSELEAGRRRTYLKLVAELLVEHLSTVRGARPQFHGSEPRRFATGRSSTRTCSRARCTFLRGRRPSSARCRKAARSTRR